MLLETRDLTSHYGRIQALADINLEVASGELVALVGANGAGKSTLMRAISGVQPVAGGSVRFDGLDITSLAPERRVRLGISQVPEGRQVFGPMAVEDNLRLGAFTRRRAGAGFWPQAALRTVRNTVPQSVQLVPRHRRSLARG